MGAFDPAPQDLPAECAVFPLPQALLLPHGRLPLNIFEPRYLAMVEDALGTGRMFGMVQPDATRPEGPNGPALYRIGCLGRITSFSETEDGRYLISLSGLARFAIAEELPMRRGYRRVRADFSAFLADLEPPSQPIEGDRQALLAALGAYFQAKGLDANWDAIKQMPDPMLVITLCMACPFDVAEKQALLEVASPAERAASLLALLQMGSHDPGEGESPTHRSIS